MIKYKTLTEKSSFLDQQNTKTYQNYLDEVLFPAVKRGEWHDLESMVVLRGTNGELVYFNDDIWPLHLIVDKEGETNIYFTHTETPYCNRKGLGKKLEQNINKELKCLTLCLIYQGRGRGVSAISCHIKHLKALSFIMLNKGLTSFSQLTIEILEAWGAEHRLLSNPHALSAFNIAIEYADYLSFEVGYAKLTMKKLRIRQRQHEQHLVAPPRIYTHLLNQYTIEINNLLPFLNELEGAIEEVVSLEQRLVQESIQRLRSGRSEPRSLFTKTSLPRLIDAYKNAGIEIADHFQNQSWEDIFFEQSPGLKSCMSYYQYWKKEPFIIGKLQFSSVGQLKRYLGVLDAKCKAICLALSGMRGDELHGMHPLYGAQIEIVEGQTIYLFTTLQSKITQSSQSKLDVFVTTKNAHNAFNLLNTLHSPFRKLFKENKQRFFASLCRTQFPYALNKAEWMAHLRTFLNSNENGLSLKLTAEDMKYINLSNPDQTLVKEGGSYKFKLHQLRRSFAYYLIGFELMAFPQLKSQLSHLSSAMTRHYANNASDFHKLQKEVNVERTRQQSEIMARVYQNIANNERIAGGKGKALKKIAGDGKNYFEKAVNKRKLDPSYWAQLIDQDKANLHAIGPSMYCTNSACSMRINIELAECVDCEHDIIESAMYAEGVRINASKNLLILEEMGELTHSVMSQLAMKIRSAEKIMADLDYDFEPFQFPQSVLDAEIGVVNVSMEVA